jgi:hypothetical protein
MRQHPLGLISLPPPKPAAGHCGRHHVREHEQRADETETDPYDPPARAVRSGVDLGAQPKREQSGAGSLPRNRQCYDSVLRAANDEVDGFLEARPGPQRNGLVGEHEAARKQDAEARRRRRLVGELREQGLVRIGDHHPSDGLPAHQHPDTCPGGGLGGRAQFRARYEHDSGMLALELL